MADISKLIEEEKMKTMPIDECEIVNLTPHSVTILDENGEPVEIPESGVAARVMITENLIGRLKGTNISGDHVFKIYGSIFADNVYNLPNYHKDSNKVYIVSGVVGSTVSASGIRPTDDLLVPEQLIKDEDGKVIGAKGLRVVD
jgi:hypothetical protein